MKGRPENQRGGKPEEAERLRINALVLPADQVLPATQDQIGASNLPEYQQLVGGLVEHVALAKPPSGMYFNEEGKVRGLPLNRRATLLLWLHNPAFRYADVITGDALLVGPVDRDGYDTNAPEELVQTLFEAKQFRAEVQTYGEAGWHGNERRFDTWVAAYSYVLDLGRRWTSVQDVRVVPEA
jgi:Domain of unknown function (DUF3846)